MRAWVPWCADQQQTGELTSLTITLTRIEEEQSCQPRYSPCRLVAGTVHDDALIVSEGLVLERFPSPLIISFRTVTACTADRLIVVATVIHERLIGLDLTQRLCIPTAQLERSHGLGKDRALQRGMSCLSPSGDAPRASHAECAGWAEASVQEERTAEKDLGLASSEDEEMAADCSQDRMDKGVAMLHQTFLHPWMQPDQSCEAGVAIQAPQRKRRHSGDHRNDSRAKTMIPDSPLCQRVQ